MIPDDIRKKAEEMGEQVRAFGVTMWELGHKQGELSQLEAERLNREAYLEGCQRANDILMGNTNET